jgi:hypothetical protein
MAKSPRILTFTRPTPKENRESVRGQLAQVLPMPRVALARAAERRLDEELVDSVLASHPQLTREQAIKFLLDAGA